jgi:hypothetical protein
MPAQPKTSIDRDEYPDRGGTSEPGWWKPVQASSGEWTRELRPERLRRSQDQ